MKLFKKVEKNNNNHSDIKKGSLFVGLNLGLSLNSDPRASSSNLSGHAGADPHSIFCTMPFWSISNISLEFLGIHFNIGLQTTWCRKHSLYCLIKPMHIESK